MRKLLPIILLLTALIASIMYYRYEPEVIQPEVDVRPEQIKAVHYFSSSWPKTFWGDFERSQVDGDLAQIKADGFNTVILVIPWMGFEIGFENGVTEPSQLYERLDWLLHKIAGAGLDYGIRISFPHSFDPKIGTDNAQLCAAIFTDSATRNNWFQYLGRIAERVDQHRAAFKFAFFSWEDFFCPYVAFPNMNKEQRLDLARRSGYQTWLAEQNSLQLLELLYDEPLGSMDRIPVPERESAAFLLFMQFVDQFLITQLIEPGRELLPELAMEVRVDRDPVQNKGEIFWAQHDLALSDEQLRGSYWGAYYGAKNQGELLNASEALKNFEFMLDEVTGYGKNTNHIVEQFNFIDNTPGFVGHAKIEQSEIEAFLQGASILLKEKSRGYGLWAYRDYADSAIYNGSFELGLRGWEVQGETAIADNEDGDKALSMQTGAVISQTFVPHARFAGLAPSEQITFCANFSAIKQPTQITLLLNGEPYGALEVSEAKQNCAAMEASTIKQSNVVFSIMADGDIQIDDIRLYSFVQVLDIYDHNGQPASLRDVIVKMNTDWLND